MITVDDLKLEIKDYNFNVLTGGNNLAAERAIVKAQSWVEAKSKVQRIPVDFEDKIIREVLIKRALYELYSYAENELIARDKKEDAWELLKGYWENSKSLDSSGYEGNGGEIPLKAVAASIQVGAKNKEF